MRQVARTKVSARYVFDKELQRLRNKHNKSRSIGINVMSFFQQIRPVCKIEILNNTGTPEKNECFSGNVFSRMAKPCLELRAVFLLLFFPKNTASLKKENFELGN